MNPSSRSSTRRQVDVEGRCSELAGLGSTRPSRSTRADVLAEQGRHWAFQRFLKRAMGLEPTTLSLGS